MHCPSFDDIQSIECREELVTINPSTSKVGMKRSEMLQEA